jgi:hypothetical protein
MTISLISQIDGRITGNAASEKTTGTADPNIRAERSFLDLKFNAIYSVPIIEVICTFCGKLIITSLS